MDSHLSTLLANLPIRVKAIQPLASPFEDSTHKIFFLQSLEGEFVLKVCACQKLADSVFWQGLEVLFDFKLAEQLPLFAKHYQWLAEVLRPIRLPILKQAGQNYLLTEKIRGQAMTSNKQSDQQVIELAYFLSQLHQQTHNRFGALTQPKLMADDWGSRVQATLAHFGIQDKAILKQAEQIDCETFSPVMLDLRWDQFLQSEQGLSLVDLDAFVWADKRLDFIILEYLLSEAQRTVFVRHYALALPSLNEVRGVYRQLLFKMNVLGEQDNAKWMAHPELF